MITVSKANHPSSTLLWFHGSHLNQRSKSTHRQSKHRVPSTRFDVHLTGHEGTELAHNLPPARPPIDNSSRASHRQAPPWPGTTTPVSPTVPLNPHLIATQ